MSAEMIAMHSIESYRNLRGYPVIAERCTLGMFHIVDGELSLDYRLECWAVPKNWLVA